jgi:hypothetical protein
MISGMAASAPVAVVALQALLAVDGGVPGVTPNMRAAQPSLLDPVPLPILKRPPPKEPYRLQPANDGTGDLVYEETTFIARVARDGVVRFVQKRATELRLWPTFFLPKRNVYMGVPSLWSSLKAAARGEEPPPPAPPPDDGSPPPETTSLIPAVSRYRPDPREGCRMCGVLRPIFPSLVVELDITDEVLRLNRQDPYRYQKAKFLVATREKRVVMAIGAHADNLRRAAADLPSVLTAIACDERRSPGDRLAILQALLEELNTDTPAGRAAATVIEQFLASRFGEPETCQGR